MKNYQQLLERAEWLERRTVILKRDSYRCSQCGNRETVNLHGTPTVIDTEDLLVYDIPGEGRIEVPNPEVSIVVSEKSEHICLQIHHKYYVLNKLPWDYPDDALVTLCHKCHYKLHETTQVPLYLNDRLDKQITLSICTKCSGTGYLPQYKHVDNGKCFQCMGSRFVEFIDNIIV